MKGLSDINYRKGDIQDHLFYHPHLAEPEKSSFSPLGIGLEEQAKGKDWMTSAASARATDLPSADKVSGDSLL